MNTVLYAVLIASCAIHSEQCPASEQTCSMIEKKYQLLNNENSYSNEIKYLDSFPSDYKGFIQCFGYKKQLQNNKISFGCLYDNYVDYIDRFFNLNKLKKKLVYKKVISITNGAFYQNDACSFLQDKIIGLIRNDVDFVLFLKSNRANSNQIYHFVMMNQKSNIKLDDFLRKKILK